MHLIAAYKHERANFQRLKVVERLAQDTAKTLVYYRAHVGFVTPPNACQD